MDPDVKDRIKEICWHLSQGASSYSFQYFPERVSKKALSKLLRYSKLEDLMKLEDTPTSKRKDLKRLRSYGIPRLACFLLLLLILFHYL